MWDPGFGEVGAMPSLGACATCNGNYTGLLDLTVLLLVLTYLVPSRFYCVTHQIAMGFWDFGRPLSAEPTTHEHTCVDFSELEHPLDLQTLGPRKTQEKTETTMGLSQNGP